MKTTKKQRQALVSSPKASFPYTIDFRTTDNDDFQIHSRIQTPTDERVFVNHANQEAEYRIRDEEE